MASINYSDKLMPIMVIALIGATFALGMMYGKVSVYEEGGVKTQNTGVTNTDTAAAPSEPPAIAEVSLGDDPVLGDENAPVTIVEFSDYECPFCKRHYTDTHLSLKEKYIDTGKVKLVFKDLPLSFHDPLATKQAVAANCAREQGGDSKYYEYHDALFETTTSGGTGMTEAQLSTLATDLGLNLSTFETCLDSEEMLQEVKDDLAYAATIGATATPSFFVGASEGDTIQGERLIGAQPITAFDAVIEKYLN